MDERVKRLEQETKELIGFCLGLMSHVRATELALDDNTRKKILHELVKNTEGEYLANQGKMLGEATVADLSRLLLMMQKGL